MYVKRYWLHISLMLVILLLAVKIVFIRGVIDSQYDQQAAARFSNKGDYRQWTFFLKTPLKRYQSEMCCGRIAEEAMSEGAGKEMLMFAYSGQVKAELKAGARQVQADVFVTGGDFPFFHDISLYDGCWYRDDDIMNDRLVIDEKTAGELFGSSDAVGMPVMVDGAEFVVCGVVQGNGNRVYASIRNPMFKDTAVSCIEMIVPEFVGGMSERIVSEGVSLIDSDNVLVCNSKRFEVSKLKSRLSVLTEGLDSYDFSVPYWEAEAQCAENKILITGLLCIPDIMLGIILTVFELIVSDKRKLLFKRLFLKS